MKHRSLFKIGLPRFKVEDTVAALSEVVDWGILKNNVPNTWSKTQGEDIKICILDSAGETDHIDLVENYIGGVNLTRSASAADFIGHSTHVAGSIAASQNGIGVVGVAPKAKFYLVKVLNNEGFGTAKSIEDGFKFCIDTKPDIVSASLGAPNEIGNCHEYIKTLYGMNIPVICAVGNTGREGINYPAAYPETIAVGAYGEDGELARFSTFGDEVDFVGPGVGIYSTWKDGGYAKLSGSSMACPFITGIVALLLSKHKKQEKESGQNDCRTVEQIKEHLRKYAIDRGDIGKDKKWGYGIVDVDALINGD